MPFHALAARHAPLPFMMRDLRGQAEAADPDPALVVYFASSTLDPDAAAAGVAETFPKARTVGCSSHREYTNAGFTAGGIVALSFGRDVMGEVETTWLPDLPNHIDATVERACAELAAAAGDPDALARADRVGLVLMDGLTGSEEAVMERLGDLSTIDFVGGSASDDWTFNATWVAADGVAKRGAGLLALLKPKCRWAVGKTQSWQVWDGPALTPTRVDLANRRVYEFDGRPAVDRYAEILGYTRETLDFPYCQHHHPLGLMANGELFVRQPSRLVDDGSMIFFCHLREGQPLRVLSSLPIPGRMAARLEAFRAELGGDLRAVLDFCCLQRYAALHEARGLDAYAALCPDAARVGFSTFGEEMIGHMNCTSTMLAFGACPTPAKG